MLAFCVEDPVYAAIGLIQAIQAAVPADEEQAILINAHTRPYRSRRRKFPRHSARCDIQTVREVTEKKGHPCLLKDALNSLSGDYFPG